MSTSVVSVRKAELKKRGISDFEEWNKRDDTLYIGRNMAFYVHGTFKSKWCNPFTVKKYGDDCMKRFEEYIRNNAELLRDIEELRGKELGCWCKPNPCHGDILVKILSEI